MSYNPTVRRFKTDVQDLVGQIGKSMRERTLAMADELIGNMQRAAPRETGTLAGSLRKKDVTKGSRYFESPSVLVIGGGQPTIKRTQAGAAYDYAVGTEFGTRKEAAEPFFYNTYRMYRVGGIAMYRETVDDAIKENNEVRALRGDNYNNNTLSSTRSVGHRGAVVIQKRAK